MFYLHAGRDSKILRQKVLNGIIDALKFECDPVFMAGVTRNPQPLIEAGVTPTGATGKLYALGAAFGALLDEQMTERLPQLKVMAKLARGDSDKLKFFELEATRAAIPISIEAAQSLFAGAAE